MSDPAEVLQPDDPDGGRGTPVDPKPSAADAATKGPSERGATPPGPPHPFVEMIRNPAARTYLLVSAGGLLVTVTGVFFFYDSVFGGVVLLLLGLTALGLRWPASPPLFAAAMVYFQFAPSGLPIFLPSVNQIPAHHFAFADLLVIAAAVVHLIAAYRFHAVSRAGMPFDAPAVFVKPGAKPTVRPPVPVRDLELWLLFARVGVFVLLGQGVWLFATKLKVDFRRQFPIRFHDSFLEEEGYYPPAPGEIFNGLSRFLLVAGLMLAVAFVVWLVVWYWRLHAMNRDEARAACLDQEWATNRREYNRPEKWRGWMKQKLAGTLPRKGCGAWFLVVGVPVILLTLFLICLGCMGAYR